MHIYSTLHLFFFFFFNDTATTEIYTLPLHDALPIYVVIDSDHAVESLAHLFNVGDQHDLGEAVGQPPQRSEEHTSELQSQSNLVCRLLLEKKKKKDIVHYKAARQTTPRLWRGHRVAQ